MKKITQYFIYCQTGCTCCSDENHMRGPFASKEDAERRISYYKAPESTYWPIASQYSRRGSYSIKEAEVESLEDGRIIIGGRVFEGPREAVVVNEDGSVADNEKEKFWGLDYL